MTDGKDRGQAVVELALMLPVLLLLMSGMLDLGRAWQTHVTTTDATRNIARVVAGLYQGSGGPPDSVVLTEAQSELARLGAPQYMATSQAPPYTPGSNGIPNPTPGSPVVVVYPDQSARTSGGPTQNTIVSVYVFYDYQLLTPIISQLAGTNGLQSTAFADMRSAW